MKGTRFIFGLARYAFAVVLLMSFHAQAVLAATLTLDPVSTSTPVGSTFDVKILVDTEGETITSVDAILTFDNTIMQVDQIVAGAPGEDPFLPDFFQNIADGEIYIGAAVLPPELTKTGTGTLATITFSGASEGVSDLIFDCTAGKSSDTNISKSDKNVTDIVDCTRLSKGQYSVGTGIVPTATLAPTEPIGKGGPLVSTPSASPTLQQITVTPGSTEVTMALVSVGVVLLIAGFGSSTVIKFLS